MAHEYGHFLTSRYSSEISILGRRGRIPAEERFADAFARCFLMPATGLRRRFNQIRSAEARVTAADICRMAYYYFVSVEAMTLRLEELRLLPSGTWDRLKDRGSGYVKPRLIWDWSHIQTTNIGFLLVTDCWQCKRTRMN